LSDTRTHRGPDPRDALAFDPSAWPALREAVADLCWLLSRGYAPTSALKLVGDRWSLFERQRAAVMRCACPDAALARRNRHQVPLAEVRDRPLLLDGFNVLTTIEAALGGAVVLRGRDGTYRDLAGIHGTYRKVEETRPALALLGEFLATLGAGPSCWYLDRPVSNSGRLQALILEAAAERGWDWRVELVFNPDFLLGVTSETVATADSAILNRCDRWVNLARAAIDHAVPSARIIDLWPSPEA
jgi:hypothetical protein